MNLNLWDWLVIAVFPGANRIPVVVGAVLLAGGLAVLVRVSPLWTVFRRALARRAAVAPRRQAARHRGPRRATSVACTRRQPAATEASTMLLPRASDEPDATAFLPITTRGAK
ncbi:hypothetical protein [Phytohabitans houttuyneae]|uniref:Uncharacterized protein n=1 Tax=Phytohabitans houttuyneae TaxID=1076126 RepID=A0A6V8K328_9ACTN|nr:hypothetical protein [Phytohabitans houttuyneae]GFJ79553.1 hypothetical protein Phou_037330 [Phytohabitans houttuyneae]